MRAEDFIIHHAGADPLTVNLYRFNVTCMWDYAETLTRTGSVLVWIKSPMGDNPGMQTLIWKHKKAWKKWTSSN